MTLKEIREMLQLMEDHELTELELEREGMKIRLKKGTGSSAPHVVVEQAAAPPSPVAGAPPAASASRPVRLTINSPMVGTFYGSPAPDAPPFVTPGQTVNEGQIICIIEAMKLMNEIKSDVAGRAINVLVANGDPVEFGQPLIALEPLS